MTPLQLAALFAVSGSVLAATVPQFFSALRASRFSEAIDGVGSVAARASAHALGSPFGSVYPESAPRTPAVVPAGRRVTDPPGTWNHATWRSLDFQMERPHYYSFEFVSVLGDSHAEFHAIAVGDLDADGQLSHFSVVGAIEDGKLPEVYPIQMIREVE